MSLPVPHALTLTSIVIGVAVLALMLSLIIHIYRNYRTLDAREIGRKEE
jgi:multicomponent Na+:H+ antiporter subunit C